MKKRPGKNNSHQYNQMKKTQREQQKAKPKLHPRGLARSIAMNLGATPSTWRTVVAGLPKKGRKYLHPEFARKEARANG